MTMIQIDAKTARKGVYIMVDGIACKVVDIQTSKPGKHGHAKCKITADGILDGKRKVIMKPGDAKLDSPLIDKRLGQVISIQGTIAQIMDLENYETFETPIPDKVKGKLIEGGEVSYWVIGIIKAIMDIKS